MIDASIAINPHEAEHTYAMHAHRRVLITLRYFPDELRPSALVLVQGIKDLLPPWATEIDVKYTAIEDGGIAQIGMQVEYRRLCLTIDPALFRTDDAERARIIDHEIAHAFIAPLSEFSRDTLTRLLAEHDAPLREALMEQLRVAVEAATQDVSALITRLRTQAHHIGGGA